MTSLNNPQGGATLGTPSTATVTIIDNDAATGPNPIDNTDFFVRQQYLDFLGREPDPPGFAAWVSLINSCTPGDTSCDRVHVSEAFFESEEFQERGYFIYRFYSVSFGRKPTYAEFAPDLARVSGFLDVNQLEAAKVAFIADFMARPAFVTIYGSLNNTQYVDTLLSTAGVTFSASARQALIDGLNGGNAHARPGAASDRGKPTGCSEVLQRGICGNGVLWLSAPRSGRFVSQLDCASQLGRQPAHHGQRVRQFDRVPSAFWTVS